MQLLLLLGLGGAKFIGTRVGLQGRGSGKEEWEEIGQFLCPCDGLGITLLIIQGLLFNMLKW